MKRLLLTPFLAVATLLAQTPTGTIVGTVTDPTGAVISNASVTIVNRNTGLNRTSATDSEGSYSTPLLPVVGGLVSRAQIENLPLNGRNFLELAKLEPGGTAPQSSLNRTFVPILGSGLVSFPRIGYTRMTVDGASIMAIGAPGAAQTVSQDVVQEFQISSVNMDLSTGLGSSGTINSHPLRWQHLSWQRFLALSRSQPGRLPRLAT